MTTTGRVTRGGVYALQFRHTHVAKGFHMRAGQIVSVFCVLLVTGISTTVWGQSPQYLPPVNLGYTSFLDGAPPAGPGLYHAQYLNYYSADKITNGNGNALPLPNPQLDVWVSLSQFIYLWDTQLEVGSRVIPGKPAIDIIIPAMSANLDFSAPVPITASRGGLGDIMIGPALQFDPIMGDNGPLFVHRIEAQINLPTGQYNSKHLINPGSNFASFNPYWAGTAFITPKDTISFRAHYLWCANNNDPWVGVPGATSTQAGDAFHINFAAEHEVIPKMLRVGVNGYYLKQTRDAQIDGVDVIGSREEVLGIGPGAILSFSQTQHVFFNVYWETMTRNRPEGYHLNLRYVHKF